MGVLQGALTQVSSTPPTYSYSDGVRVGIAGEGVLISEGQPDKFCPQPAEAVPLGCNQGSLLGNFRSR